MNANKYRVLISDLAQTKADVRDILSKVHLLLAKIGNQQPDEFDIAAMGYTLHSLYTCIESGLLRIAKTFENEIEPLRWHRALLDRMNTAITDVRPAVLSEQSWPGLNKLCAFRHFFRNAYTWELDWEQIESLVEVVDQTVTDTIKDIDLFIGFCNSLIS